MLRGSATKRKFQVVCLGDLPLAQVGIGSLLDSALQLLGIVVLWQTVKRDLFHLLADGLAIRGALRQWSGREADVLIIVQHLGAILDAVPCFEWALVVLVVAPLFVLGQDSSGLFVAYDVGLTIFLIGAFSLLGSLLVLQGSSFTVTIGQGIHGSEFLRIGQNAVLRSDEIVVGSCVVIATETTNAIAVVVGELQHKYWYRFITSSFSAKY